MKKHSEISKKTVYIRVLLLTTIFMGILWNSFYWPYEGIGKRKIAVGMVVLACEIVVPILAIQIPILYQFFVRKIQQIHKNLLYIKENYRNVVKIVCLAVLCVILSWGTAGIISKFVLQTAYNVRLFYTILALCAVLLSVIFGWKDSAKKPERIFVIIALTLGIFSIGVTPDRVGVSWDDQIHYRRTLEISNLFNGIMFEADEQNIANAPFYYSTGYDRESDQSYVEEIEGIYATKAYRGHDFHEYSVWSVSYVPSAIGIIMGRGLGLSYVGVFNSGRLFNLLMYITLIYFSIKRIRYGKILIAAIGLMPTSIFMASSYSYDIWVTGFTILGFTYFFAELQEDSLLENKNIIIMIGAMALGCMPKAIYFPLLFPLLFMPRKKFRSSKQRRWYYLAIVAVGLFLVATFLLPRFFNGMGTGDPRGGSEVNSTKQLEFILNNPIAYAGILIRYMARYITLEGTSEMFDSLAYVGMGYIFSVVSFIYVVVAFLDRGEHEKNNVAIKGATLLGCAATIVLSITALYISFTAVASDTVAGMQGRYMIPTLFPALFSLGIGGTTHKINKNAFVCVPMLIIAITFICNMFAFCVINY